MDSVGIFKAMVRAGKFPHAMLLEGPGAKDFAQFVATTAVCTAAEKPCGQCAACRKAADHAHPDILPFYPVGAKKQYPVETVRQIRTDAYVLPNEAARKVYILYDVDNIAPPAQNALLKILEEPPAHVVFVLTCLQKSALLQTVLSRVLLFACRGEDSFSEQAQHAAEEMLKAVLSVKELDLLQLTHAASSDKQLFLETLAAMAALIRQAWRCKCGLPDINPAAKELAGSMTIAALLKMIDAVDTVANAVRANGNMRLCATRLCALLKSAAGK